MAGVTEYAGNTGSISFVPIDGVNPLEWVEVFADELGYIGGGSTDDSSIRPFAGLMDPNRWRNINTNQAISVPYVQFAVDPRSGARPLTMTCKASVVGSGTLPKGTYTWTVDGVADSGSLETHAQKSYVLKDPGPHSISLKYTLTGRSPISCPEAQMKSNQAVAMVWPEIRGKVIDSNGGGVGNVTLTTDAGGTSTTTDPNGEFTIHVPYNWNGNLTARSDLYSLAPASRSYSGVTQDLADQSLLASYDPNRPFRVADALAMLQSMPSYSGGTRLLFQFNSGFFGSDPNGVAIARELARVGGTNTLNVSYCTGKSIDAKTVQLQVELADQGVPIWLEMNALSGLGAYAAIESLDPNYLHRTPQPASLYVVPEWQNKLSRPSRFLYCPSRAMSRRLIARWFAVGCMLRNAGLDAKRVAGIWAHDETAYVAGRNGETYVYNTLYSECPDCGSIENFNRKLGELHADTVHALLRGLGAELAGDLNRDGVEDEKDATIWQQASQKNDPIGDVNNDGLVNSNDLTAWQAISRSPRKEVARFWWGGGYIPLGNGNYAPSPYVPLTECPALPLQTYACFGHYTTDSRAMATWSDGIDYNKATAGKPVMPFLGLTYDGTTGSETGVDPLFNKAKAQAAASKGCPMIGCYAMNPPSGGWMTPELFRKQFEAVKVLVEGCRSGQVP